MPNIEISRKLSRRVRGLHRAIKLHNRDGHYYGNKSAVSGAVKRAKRGQYGFAEQTLKSARRYGWPTVEAQAQVNGKARAINVENIELNNVTTADQAFNQSLKSLESTVDFAPEKSAVGTLHAKVLGRAKRMVKVELSKKFLAATYAKGCEPTPDEMFDRQELENTIACAKSHLLDPNCSESKREYLNAGINKLTIAIERLTAKD